MVRNLYIAKDADNCKQTLYRAKGLVFISNKLFGGLVGCRKQEFMLTDFNA
jgi:hypothetical protein